MVLPKRTLPLAIAALLGASAGYVWLKPTPEPVGVIGKPSSAGKAAFDANCKECHGEDGLGSDKGPPLIHRIYHPGHHSDLSFFLAVKNGVKAHHWPFGDMPPQPEVNETDVAAILLYIRDAQRAAGIGS